MHDGIKMFKHTATSAISKIRRIADDLDEIVEKFGIHAVITGSVKAIIAIGGLIVSFFMAPFTVGASRSAADQDGKDQPDGTFGGGDPEADDIFGGDVSSIMIKPD